MFDTRTRATILAALRGYQQLLATGRWPTGAQLTALHQIAGDPGESENPELMPLSPEEIDELCEQLNREALDVALDHGSQPDSPPDQAGRRPLFSGPKPKPGQFYRHFKRGTIYEVIAVSHRVDRVSRQRFVIYRRKHGTDYFAREITDFCSLVPDPQNAALEVPRFALLENQPQAQPSRSISRPEGLTAIALSDFLRPLGELSVSLCVSEVESFLTRIVAAKLEGDGALVWLELEERSMLELRSGRFGETAEALSELVAAYVSEQQQLERDRTSGKTFVFQTWIAGETVDGTDTHVWLVNAPHKRAVRRYLRHTGLIKRYAFTRKIALQHDLHRDTAVDVVLDAAGRILREQPSLTEYRSKPE